MLPKMPSSEVVHVHRLYSFFPRLTLAHNIKPFSNPPPSLVADPPHPYTLPFYAMTPFVASLLVAFTLLPRPTLGRPITPPMLDARQNISTRMELVFNIVFSLGEVKLF